MGVFCDLYFFEHDKALHQKHNLSPGKLYGMEKGHFRPHLGIEKLSRDVWLLESAAS